MKWKHIFACKFWIGSVFENDFMQNSVLKTNMKSLWNCVYSMMYTHEHLEQIMNEFLCLRFETQFTNQFIELF